MNRRNVEVSCNVANCQVCSTGRDASSPIVVPGPYPLRGRKRHRSLPVSSSPACGPDLSESTPKGTSSLARRSGRGLRSLLETVLSFPPSRRVL